MAKKNLLKLDSTFLGGFFFTLRWTFSGAKNKREKKLLLFFLSASGKSLAPNFFFIVDSN